MAAYIAIILSIISIILLITFIVKFNKLFSTEAIIEKTKAQMNKIISDINKNANMDIDLINEATRRTRNLIKETDAKIDEFKEATDILRDMIATVESSGNISIGERNHIYKKNNLVDDIKPVSKLQEERKVAESQKNDNITPTATEYKINAYKNHQQSLFEDENSDNTISLKHNKSYNSASNDDATLKQSHSMPKIVTNIKPSERTNTTKKLNDKVEKLFNSGMQVEDIAVELSCSVSEVQFIIDMLNERG